jgi:two-component system cell cycle sensor histidine kinase/response regulator CckA
MDALQRIPPDPDEREALFRLLLEAAYDGLVIIHDGVITDVSSGLLAASGYSEDELIGRPLTDFVAEEFRDTIRQRDVDGAEGRLDAVAVLKDSRRLQVEIVTRRFVIGGRPVRVSALRDVTARRQLEAQLHQAQKMDALGRLASGIAHDFNNILHVVRSLSELLSQELTGQHRRDALEIAKAADTGAAITRQLLEFSRQQPPLPVEVDLNALVTQSEVMLRRWAGSGVELVMDLASELKSIAADRTQMQQVLLNLVINAHDAMPNGGRITVRTRNVGIADNQALGSVPARPGQYVMLSVTDSGTGMSEEVKAHIFEPFFTTKDAGRGTGMGLAIVRSIVEQSRGFIIVDSTIGAGSTFAIYLPSAEKGRPMSGM